MKSHLVLTLLIITSSLTFCNAQEPLDFKKVEWLIGTWNRTNISKPGKTSHERWVKASDNELRGWGVSMQGADTIFVEKTSIVWKDNALYYVADVPDNKDVVYFKFTSVTENGFVCENPTHDFPKKISYQLEGTKLKAQISGDGKAIDYLFKRKQ